MVAALERADIPTASLNEVPAVADHPQFASATAMEAKPTRRTERFRQLIPPDNLSKVTPAMGKVPALGEHTEEVLRMLGEWFRCRRKMQRSMLFVPAVKMGAHSEGRGG